MNPAGGLALAKLGPTLYLAYRDQSKVLHYAVGNGADGTWQPPSPMMTVTTNGVVAASDPSLMVSDGYLVLTVGGASGNSVFIYRNALDANGNPGMYWELYRNGLVDSANDSITVKSLAQVFAYADGYAIVGTNPANNNIRTIVPVHDNNPLGSWNSSLVNGTNAWAQTGSPVAVIFYQGNPYLIYADSAAGNALTAVTSAVTPLHTIPGGTQ